MKVSIDDQEYILLTQCPLLDTSERYAFKTDVHKSYNGSTEERIPEIDEARQSLAYSLSSYRAETVGLFNETYSWMRKEYLVPQPLESKEVGNLADDFIECDTSGISIAADHFILIQPESGALQVRKVTEIGRYEVVNNETVYIDGYRLNQLILANDATIYPLRKCIIDGNVNAQINNATFSPMLSLRVLDNVEYPIAVAPQQYKNEDIYFMPLLLDGDYLDVEFRQHQSIVDGEIGKFWSFTNWANPLVAKNLRILMRSREEYHQLKQWFYRRRGMLNAFWLPTYEHNFNIISASSSSLVVKNESFLSNKTSIAVKSNGVWSAHAITNKTVNSGNVSMQVSPTLPAAIERISYLDLYRLGSDTIEFMFKGNDIIETTLPIVELSQ
ncbi:MAG: hypothetical protein RSC05_12765 [Acinetobacter sp.]